MKRKKITSIAIVVYIVAMAAMFTGVFFYIKAKDKRLHQEIHDGIISAFEGNNEVVGLVYSGYSVAYDKVAIPKSPDKLEKSGGLSDNDKQIDEFAKDALNKWQKEWNEKYGDLYKMYKLRWNNDENQDGWCLVVITYDYINGEMGTCVSNVFPYAVGYKKQEFGYYFYEPSVQSAVNAAFEFYTNNEISDFYGIYDRNSADALWSKLYEADNQYYYLGKNEYPVKHYIGTSIDLDTVENHYSDNTPIYRGFMHNGFYKVFIAETQPVTYSIKKYSWNPDIKERNKLWLYLSIALTVALLAVVIPISISDRKHKKIKEEGVYDKLIRLCNPANFMKEYDKDKVDKANVIYNKLLQTSNTDVETLNNLLQQAAADLGVSLIDKEKLEELREKVNPKNFMNPYNAEKVALSNELFSILNKEEITYNEMIQVEERAKLL